jgi:DNA-binding winged helix-turn-helix (wHTH) protein/Flp pilus assembly protein TadD
MSIYHFGPFELDGERLLLLDRGEHVALGPKVVATLLALVERPGTLLTKNELLDRIWPEGYVDEANLTQNVHVLRKTLRARWNVEAIETIPRRGYRFNASVSRRETATIVPARAPSVRRAAWRVAVAAAALVVTALAAAASLYARQGGAAPSVPALSRDAERMYVIGRYYWNQRTYDSVRKSMIYFARVIDLDPRKAQGYAAMADADAIMGDYGFGTARPAVYFARARAYAQKALAIDAGNAEAYAVLGMIAAEKQHDGGLAPSTARGIDFLRRAIRLDPSDAAAHEWYGIALLQLGRVDSAYSQLRRAAELDPLSVATTDWLGMVAYLERHYTEAIAYERETLDLAPQRVEVYETLGLAYEALGDSPRAMRAFETLGRNRHCRAEAAALLAELYAHSKQFSKARAELQIAQAHQGDVAPEDIAVALAAIGDSRTALSWLHRVHGREYLKLEIANDPRFNVLRKIISS